VLSYYLKQNDLIITFFIVVITNNYQDVFGEYIMSVESSIFAKCICTKDVKVETIIVGFPGMGLVGAIAAQHMAEKLELETVGFIEGTAIPPVAVFLDGILRHPYRIMAKEGLDVGIFIGESPVSAEGAYYIAKAVIDWSKKHGAKEIITLDGFGFMDKNDEGKVHMVAEPEITQKTKIDIPPLKSGYIKGFAGAILNQSLLDKIDGYSFLVGTRPELPDPGGAAELINVINDWKNLDVKTDTLKEQSDSIKRKLKEFAEQTQQQMATEPTGKKRSTFYT
jgi:uncharacterized protein